MAAGDLITGTDQLEWRNTLLGNGSIYAKVELEGWLDQPDLREGDINLDQQHGAQLGQLLADRRVITLTGHIATKDEAEFRAAVNTLRRITTLGANPVEELLVVSSAGITGVVWARCIGRIIPETLDHTIGYARFTVRWRATNPRILRLPQQVVSTGPAMPSSGSLNFVLDFPLHFGGLPSGGQLSLPNNGYADAQPVWRITGPCTGARITNLDTGRRLWLSDEYELPAGQTLDLSTVDKSVLLQSSGVSRSNQLIVREWFELPAGSGTRVGFETVDGLGQLSCVYYHTDM